MDIIAKRKEGLEQFVQESYPVIIDFAERLEHPDPSTLLLDNVQMSYFLETVHLFMKEEEIDDETRLWVSVRLGYLLGEYLIQKYQGFWGVNDSTESLQYGHYVVFAVSPSNSKKIYPIDTFETANHFVLQEAPRSLVQLIDEIEGLIV
jgi:hypothetical protein